MSSGADDPDNADVSPDPRAAAVTVARADTPHGEVALRRRGLVLKLVVDGTFAMDTVDTTTEVALPSAPWRATRRPAACSSAASAWG